MPNGERTFVNIASIINNANLDSRERLLRCKRHTIVHSFHHAKLVAAIRTKLSAFFLQFKRLSRQKCVCVCVARTKTVFSPEC
jgi:hypothetical protein